MGLEEIAVAVDDELVELGLKGCRVAKEVSGFTCGVVEARPVDAEDVVHEALPNAFVADRLTAAAEFRRST